jgi:NAD(P)-dependent dehydrogenase (short-subunit alcohol dehydrogenase family)
MGGNVAVIDALPEPVEEFNTLNDKYGVQASYFHGDVTKQDSLEQAFEGVVQSAGEINGCVTAAGIVIDKPFFDHDFEESMRVLAVNVMGTFWTAKLVSQHMAKHGKGGSLVMIASVAAQGIKIPQQNVSVYNMSKAGVKGLVGPLSVEMAVNNIRVNSISPGVIMSPMTEGLKTMYPELLKMFENAAPARRIGVPADLTPAVVYLLSDAASFTTGADLPITGGLHAGTSMEWLEH